MLCVGVLQLKYIRRLCIGQDQMLCLKKDAGKHGPCLAMLHNAHSSSALRTLRDLTSGVLFLGQAAHVASVSML